MLAIWHEIRRRDEVIFNTFKEPETLYEKVELMITTMHFLITPHLAIR